MANHSNPHDTKFNRHPEKPERILRIFSKLVEEGLVTKMHAINSRYVTKEELLLGHDESYINQVTNIFMNPDLDSQQIDFQMNCIDGDIYANIYSLECALLAAGSSINLVDSIVSGQIERGGAIVRPPGHHAESNTAMGFCYFNNVALAAIKARNTGLKVAVVDFYVHHGNGTQEILKGKDNLYFFSIHRYDKGGFYPYNGSVSDEKNIFNYPLNVVEGNDEEYQTVFSDHIIPELKKIKPDLILVSAGFDAAKGDPLGHYNVTPDGYKSLVNMMLSVQPKLALVLEGGYNLTSISNSMAECVDALLSLE